MAVLARGDDPPEPPAMVNLAALTEAVRRRASGAPLDLIEAALAVSDELTAAADEVIGQFVAEARAAGCSWTEIGQRIGVSKQAARQRFVRQAAADARTAPRQRPRRR